MKTQILFLGLMIAFFCTVSSSYADVPQMINYQGRLTDTTGAAIDTTVSMTFTIYTDSVGADSLWSETQASVEIEDGIFNVLLGSVTPMVDSVFNGSTKYLGVQVESDPEMRPLKPMVSVAYAFHSSTADTAWYALPDADWVIEGDDIYHEEGNVGIGTSGPNSRLEVLPGAGFTGSTLKATTAGYKAIHGVGGPGSQAVYGEITGAAGSGQGVMGYVPGTCTAVKGVCTGNGVGGRFESASTVVGNPALYAYNSTGYDYPGLIVYGTSEFNGYATFTSGKTGYVVDICQSDDNERLEEGDVVMVTGVSSPVVGQVPVMKVRKADTKYSTSVVGVVDRRYSKEEKRTVDTAVEKEDYLTAVTLGAYKSIKVDASYAPIEVGDLLTSSSNPGYAMKAINPEVGSIIGKALEPLTGATGIIKVFVTLK